MTFEQIISQLKKKIYHPVYLISGEETYYIDEITNYIATHVLTSNEKEFNQVILYGKDVDIRTINTEARRYPMMANHYVLIVKEAQDLKNIEDIEQYLNQMVASTILVLSYRGKKVDKRKKFVKTIEEKGVFFESKRIYDNQVAGWIENYLKEKGYTIDVRSSAILADYLGNDLGKIVNELTKLMILVPKGTAITPVLIEENIGISKDFNNFELNAALGKKDIYKSNQIANYFGENTKEHPIVVTITTLFNYFTQVLLYHSTPDKSPRNVAAVLGINPFFVKDYELAAKKYSIPKLVQIISLLREYDGKSKGVDNISTSEPELLKELVYKILH